MPKLPPARTLRVSIVFPAACLLALLAAAPVSAQPAEGIAEQATAPSAAKANIVSLPDAPAPTFSATLDSPDSSSPDSSSPDSISDPKPDEAAGSDTPQAAESQQDSSSRQTLPKPAGQNPQAPAPPSLSDLGLSPSQTKADPDLQARLDRHTRMLRIHQRLGIITLAPLAGACITSALAPPDLKKGKNNETGRDIHVGLGAASVVMYGFTASYAIRAPRVSDAPARGGIKLHKYLIYIHAPGMILTPILGAMAYNQANNGEKVHGIASAHAAVAWTTVAAYGAAIVAVSWPIHVGSWKL
jgi:hypothetical protein